MHLTFYMPRPKGHYGKRGLLPSAPKYPVKKPDLDKLVRAVGDALVPVLIHDDNQVVWILAGKEYASEQEPPGVLISLHHHDPRDAD